MSKKERLVYAGLILLWLSAVLTFWVYWLNPIHRGAPLLFWLTSFAFFYDGTLLPSIFLYYLGKMKKPVEIPAIKASEVVKRVALITLTVPGSESTDIVERQLKAMSEVTYPHDSWLLVDKEHSPKLKALAKKYNANYFSRHDTKKWGVKKIASWNQPIPPFKAKTKAGNVNAWIDAYGEIYTHFTQLDIDHNPRKDYLDRVLGYFAVKNIAWVQAPSVYGNFKHWTAKGASEQELVLQGPLQMGFFGTTGVPFIIGSHCTYSMKAIREIDGFQPTRAEDHLDTLYLAAKGYRGVFVPDVIAVGDGPETFETYLSQQFAWAYSLMQVLLKHSPKKLKSLDLPLILQFLFTQTWYPLWSFAMLFLFLSPAISLLMGVQISHTGLLDFILHSMPLTIVGFVAWFWSKKWQKPSGVGLSWKGIVLHIARWFIVVSATIQATLNVTKPYMITKKGGNHSFNYYTVIPYLLLSALMLFISAWFVIVNQNINTRGYLLFSLENVLLMTIVCIAPVFIAIKQREITLRNFISSFKSLTLFTALIVTLFFEIGVATANLMTSRPQSVIQVTAVLPYHGKGKFFTNPPEVYSVTAQAGDSMWSLSQSAVKRYEVDNNMTVPRSMENRAISLVSKRYFMPHVYPGMQIELQKQHIQESFQIAYAY